MAKGHIENARQAVAKMIGCRIPDSIIFTSCGTESISQAFFIASEVQLNKNSHFIISGVEHSAVQETSEYHASKGSHISVVGVDGNGNLDLKQLRQLLTKTSKGSFVSLMLANNETGVIFPIAEIAEICKIHGVYLHVDAVQAAGKLPFNVEELGCHYLSLSAHKFHGPKGVGALYICPGAPKVSFIRGHQENGMRGGTENLPGIVGMGVAAESVVRSLSSDIERMKELRDRLESLVIDAIPGTAVNGDTASRLCNTSNIYFPGRNAANLVEQLSARGVYVSAGAACSTGGKPSHVLRAMGMSDERANASLRFSLSKSTTVQEIDLAVAAITIANSSSLTIYNVM